MPSGGRGIARPYYERRPKEVTDEVIRRNHAGELECPVCKGWFNVPPKTLCPRGCVSYGAVRSRRVALQADKVYTEWLKRQTDPTAVPKKSDTQAKHTTYRELRDRGVDKFEAIKVAFPGGKLDSMYRYERAYQAELNKRRRTKVK